MWLCRQDVPNHATLWGYVCLLSVAMHCIAGMFLFIVYRSYYVGTINIGKHNELSVVLLPLCKKTGASLNASRRGTQPQNSHATRAQQKIKTGNVASHKQSKKKEEGQQRTSLTTKEIQKKSSKESSIKKENKKNAKKEHGKKNEMAKSSKNTEQCQETVAATHNQPSSQTSKDQEKLIDQQTPDSEAPIYVGQAEYDFLQMYGDIQRQIEQHWRQPILPPAAQLVCDIRITIDWHGKLIDTKIEKSSGVLMYDISARTSLAAVEFPRSAYGKEIIIHFST